MTYATRALSDSFMWCGVFVHCSLQTSSITCSTPPLQAGLTGCTVLLDKDMFKSAQDCFECLVKAGSSWDLSRKALSDRDVDCLQATAVGVSRVHCFARINLRNMYMTYQHVSERRLIVLGDV